MELSDGESSGGDSDPMSGGGDGDKSKRTKYDASNDPDVKQYDENVLTQTKNSGILNGLEKLTTTGQLKALMFEALEEISTATGKSIPTEERNRLVSDLDRAFTRLGITVSSAAPQVKTAAGIISAGYMAENMMLEIQNQFILTPRIEKKFPGYFDPTSNFNRNNMGGGGNGGGW